MPSAVHFHSSVEVVIDLEEFQNTGNDYAKTKPHEYSSTITIVESHTGERLVIPIGILASLLRSATIAGLAKGDGMWGPFLDKIATDARATAAKKEQS